MVLLAWAAAAAALHWFAQRHEDRALRVLGHGLFALVVPWLALRLLLDPLGVFGTLDRLPILNAAAALNLTVIGLLFATVQWLPSAEGRLLYRCAGHAAALAWIGHELLFLPVGHGWALLAWAGYAVLLEYRRGESDPEASPLAQMVCGTLGLVVAVQLWRAPADGTLPIFNLDALAAAGVLVGAAALALRTRSRAALWAYRALIHAGALVWLWHELVGVPQGNALITVTWAVYALLILIAGLRRNEVGLIYGAVGTLLLVVGKLFLVDLGDLEVSWRSLLFIGFGIAFLLLSYYLQSWLKRAPQV